MRSKNFYVMEAKRKKYREDISWIIFEKILNADYSKSEFPLEKATVTFDIYFKTNRKRDSQNYLGGGLISWLDALVDLKLIADDSNDVIGQPIVNFHIDKANPRTEITIEGR